MESLQAKIYKLLISVGGFKKSMQRSDIHIKSQKQWDLKGEPDQPRKTGLQKRMSDITPYYILTPELKTNPNVILWLHGGGYLTGPGQTHFDLLAKICNLSGSTGILVKYPKAPEATYKTTLAQLLVLYRRLLEDFKDVPITIMGDSAGGGLGLAFTLYLKELQIKLPNKLFLFSPWVDISMQNPEILALDHKDVLLGIEGLKAQGKMYAGENADLSDYKLSPINGNFKGLPPIFLTVSAQELFLPDCRKLRALAVQAGVEVTYIEHPNLFHDWVLFPMPEATAMIEKIADQLQNTRIK